MSTSRREFLQTSAIVAAGLAGGSSILAETPKPTQTSEKSGTPIPAGSMGTPLVPTMAFGGVEISRMILGVNPMYGFAHYNANFGASMAEWYTQERVCEVLHRAAAFGINAFNYVNIGRARQDLDCFRAQGGKMHLIIQVTAHDDPAALVKDLKPLALQRRGEEIDAAFKSGSMAAERDWCKKARDLGVRVGVGTHKPEVIDLCESQGWDVDFYAGCVYNRTRTPEEIRHILGGEMVEMPGELYLQSDPERMYKAMRQTQKPCFAFKILAAGRVADGAVEAAFRTAFQSIKPIDGVYVGMYPRRRDEVKVNAEIVHKILSAA